MLRGSSEHEPSPSNSACRNTRLSAVLPGPDEVRHALVGACQALHLGERAVAERREILDVQLVAEAAGLDRPRVDVARAADDPVIGVQDGTEEVLVDVVEARSPLAEPALGHERASEKGEHLLIGVDARQVIELPERLSSTRSPGPISSSSFHISSGTPAISTRHRTGWLAVPVSS